VIRGSLAAAVLALVAALSLAGAPAGGASRGPRTIEVTIHFSRFDPGAFDVRPGERVRFVIRNLDPIDHEFIVGDERVQDAHERGTERVHPPRPGEVTVPALGSVETTYRFPVRPGSLLFGCHLPGHYAYGMRGTIDIG